MHRRLLLGSIPALLAAPAVLRAQAANTLDFYYPIAVGGPIPAVIDFYCQQFRAETGIEVRPVYAGITARR